MSAESLLYLIALASTRSADAAVAEAIEMGVLSADCHTDSFEWDEALSEAAEF